MPDRSCSIAAVLGGLLLGVPAMLSGQTPAGTDSLLKRLTAEAIASAPAILRSDALSRAASTRVRPAGALPDPMVNVGVMDLTLPRFGFRESDFTEVDFELSQQFPWPGTLGSQTRAARAAARGASAETSVLRRDVAVRVATLYYRLRYIITAEQILAKQRGLVETAVEISTARYGTGSVPQSDPLQARIALARLVTERAALVAEESGVRADLRAVRGVRGSDAFRWLRSMPTASRRSRWRRCAASSAPVGQRHAPLTHPRLGGSPPGDDRSGRADRSRPKLSALVPISRSPPGTALARSARTSSRHSWASAFPSGRGGSRNFSPRHRE